MNPNFNFNTYLLGLGVTIMLCASVLGTAIYLYSPYYGRPIMIYGGILGFLIELIEVIKEVKNNHV